MSRRPVLVFLTLTLALALAGCAGGSAERKAGDGAGGGLAQKPVYEISGLHPTYEGVGALIDEADAIVLGVATGSKVIEGESVEDDPDGAPLSGLPMTEYDFQIEEVAKGPGELKGKAIPVRVLGGETPEASYIVESGGSLVLGSAYLLFLRAGVGGAYYPLAGDSAAARKTVSGDYALPPGVIGAEAATVPATAIDFVGEHQAPPPSPPVGATSLPVRAPLLKRAWLLAGKGAVKLILTCSQGSASCAGRIELFERARKPRRLALGRYGIPAAEQKSVKLRLSRNGRRLLANSPSPGLTLQLLLDPDGDTEPSARVLKLRAQG